VFEEHGRFLLSRDRKSIILDEVKETLMAIKVRVNLANEQELLEVPGFGPAQAAAIIRYRSEHGPIMGADQLARVLSGFALNDAQRECADFSPSDGTAPEAPGA
jgi:predicted DNA-binding helix-hairpin-helix protein